jgi:plasmid maintenance system antidote protein VapI
MQEHTRKHHIERVVYSEKKSEEEKPMSIGEFIQENFADLPNWAIVLRGFRNREGLSQKSLGELIGIAQTNISQMELGKRPIGKALAKRFANFFKTDYRLFL